MWDRKRVLHLSAGQWIGAWGSQLFPINSPNVERFQKFCQNRLSSKFVIRMWVDAQHDGRPAKQVASSAERPKVWLTHTAGVRCSNADKENARLGRRVNFAPGKIPLGARAPESVYIVYQPRRRPNIMKVWVTSVERRRCSNEAKTRNPLKFAGGTPKWSIDLSR